MALSKYDIELDLAAGPDTSHAYMVELIGHNGDVLDVGCDTGYLGEVLATRGNRVAGVEIDEVTAEAARQRLTEVFVADLEATDLVEHFGAGRFDVVVFGDVLEHLRDPLPVLRRARDLLKPGGSVVISTPNVAHGDIRLSLLQGNWRYTKVGILDHTHTRFFTRESLDAFAQEAGFVVTDWRRTSAPLFGTETELDPAAFPADLVQRLAADPEATTYQFVVRIVPADAATHQAAIAGDLDTARTELAGARREIEQLRHELAGARAAAATPLTVRSLAGRAFRKARRSLRN